MASYAVAANEIGAYAKTAVAATVDTITFTDAIDQVRVVKDDGAALYITVDGTAPTVAGASTHELPAGVACSIVLRTPQGTDAVKVISSGTPVYSVARV